MIGGPWNPSARKGDYVAATALIKEAWCDVEAIRNPQKFRMEDYDLWCKFVEHDFRGSLRNC